MRNPNTGTLRGRHMTRSTANASDLSHCIGKTVTVDYRDREGNVSTRTGRVDSIIGEPGTAKHSVVLDMGDKGYRTLNMLRVTVK